MYTVKNGTVVPWKLLDCLFWDLTDLVTLSLYEVTVSHRKMSWAKFLCTVLKYSSFLQGLAAPGTMRGTHRFSWTWGTHTRVSSRAMRGACPAPNVWWAGLWRRRSPSFPFMECPTCPTWTRRASPPTVLNTTCRWPLRSQRSLFHFFLDLI